MCVSLDESLKRAEGVQAPHLRYHVLDLHRTDQADRGLLFQYYAIATGTILFYDYLLTLSDEVCRSRVSPSSTTRFFAETAFY